VTERSGESPLKEVLRQVVHHLCISKVVVDEILQSLRCVLAFRELLEPALDHSNIQPSNIITVQLPLGWICGEESLCEILQLLLIDERKVVEE
jgi:hypothetical protein